MSNEVIGFISRVGEQTGDGAKGEWKKYSFQIMDENGTVSKEWYKGGFLKKATDPVPVAEGNKVKFSYTVNDYGNQVDKGSLQVKNDVVAPVKKEASKPSYAPRKTAEAKKSDMFGDIGGYNTEDDIRRMALSNASTRAIELAALLLDNDALPVTTAKASKAVNAKRYEEVLAYVDKLTVKLFYDAATTRLLDNIEDEGEVDLAPRGELPEAANEPEEESEGDW